MFIQFLQACNNINESLFLWFDNFIESLHWVDWLSDAIIDSVHTIPFLFIIFLIIGIIEYYCFDNIKSFIRSSEHAAPVLCSFLAIIPQCGFSIIASLLYLRKYLTKGTLLAIYLATSDEALPILLTCPAKFHYILPIILIKLAVAIIFGYLVDWVLKEERYFSKFEPVKIKTKGCCSHSLGEKLDELLIHPIKHTINIFLFILLITVFLNFFINVCLQYNFVNNMFHHFKIFTPVITALLGLIPNCAISVSLTMLLINGTLSFSSVMAGLLSNAGLGILILLKRGDDFKDALKIIFILLTISIFMGYMLQLYGV